MRVLIVLCLAICASSLRVTKNPSSLRVIENPEAKPVKEAVTSDFTTPPLFYMTAMSELAAKHQTRLWLASIRSSGKWKGEIVIVTDRPTCLEKNLGEELLGEKETSSDLMDVYQGGKGNGKIYVYKQTVTTNIRKMKQQKALAWKNVRKLQLNPSFIVHTDQDIIFGDDLNIFVDYVKDKFKDDTPLLALFRDQGTTAGQLHTGIVLMFPSEKTDACLEKWGQKILTQPNVPGYHSFWRADQEWTNEEQGEKWLNEEQWSNQEWTNEATGEKFEAEQMGPDQKALAAQGTCTANHGIRIMDKKFLMMPTAGSIKSGNYATFLHFTNTNRWKNIGDPEKKEYFTNVLKIPSIDFVGKDEC